MSPNSYSSSPGVTSPSVPRAPSPMPRAPSPMPHVQESDAAISRQHLAVLSAGLLEIRGIVERQQSSLEASFPRLEEVTRFLKNQGRVGASSEKILELKDAIQIQVET